MISFTPSSRLPSFSTSSVFGRTSIGTATTGSSLEISIDPFLERLRADAAIGVDEALALAALLEIGRDQRVDRFDDLLRADGGPEDAADRRLAEINVAAQTQLILFHAVPVDAQDADMADMVVAAGVDAARDLDLEVADIVLTRQLGKMGRDALRDRDRARVGQRAIVEAGTGDDVGDLADVRLGEAQPLKRAIDRRQILDRDMRQHQVLLVADPDVALAVGVGDVSHAFHLHRTRIARRRTGGLQRRRHDTVARHPVRGGVGFEPEREGQLLEPEPLHRGHDRGAVWQPRRGELNGDRLDRLGRQLQRAILDLGKFGLDLLTYLLDAEFAEIKDSALKLAPET